MRTTFAILWLHLELHHRPLDCVGQEDQPPTGPGHLGDVGVLSPRVDQGGVTPAASCQEEASRADEDEPREDQAIHVDVIISERGSVWPRVRSRSVLAMQRRLLMNPLMPLLTAAGSADSCD